MTFDEHVVKHLKEPSLLHLLTGLSAECGEVSSLFQKAIYKRKPLSTEKLKEELGDVIFYVTAIAEKHNMTLEDLLNGNIEKLTRRNQ